MLREPQSLYQIGISSSMRKYKVTQLDFLVTVKEFFDTEVKVVENAYPHGFNCLQ
jgi:hypothetical protein